MSLQTHNDVIERNDYTAEVIRTSRRKTASIKVNEGKVSVIVPSSLSLDKIESLLIKKDRWIKEKLVLHDQIVATKSKEFVSGESFSYLGRNYRLKIVEGQYPDLKLHQGRFVASVRYKEVNNAPSIKQMLIRWYKQHAESKLIEKTQRYAKIIGVAPASIGIKSFQSRWGSCSSTSDIVYNWKIIMAPNRVVDYVVVHELCHIHHHNHSPQFWQLVNRYCPDYIECKDWLRLNGKSLGI